MNPRKSIKSLKTRWRYWTAPRWFTKFTPHPPSAPPPERERRAVIVAPASPGSIGDEAMMQALSDRLQERGVRERMVATWREQDDWQRVVQPVSQLTLPQSRPARWGRFSEWLQSASTLYVLGADVVDGVYGAEPALAMLAAAQVAAQRGLRSVVVGSSVSQTPSPLVVKCLPQLHPGAVFLARDVHSQQRLTRLIHRPVPLVADIAFLLKPAEPAPGGPAGLARVLDWICRQRKRTGAPGVVLGCNLNPQPLIKDNRDPARLSAAFLETIQQLLAIHGRNLSVLVMPHDYRREHRELEACEAFHQMLPEELKPDSLCLREPLTAAEIKAIAGQCDAVLTGRMHLAIAALGGGTPAICLGYQDKFEGLLAHFGAEELVLNWRDAIAPGRLPGWVAGLVARRQEWRARIQDQLPRVMDLARANLDAGFERG